jgi:cytochrome c oxidase cbb3-type subunit 3
MRLELGVLLLLSLTACSGPPGPRSPSFSSSPPFSPASSPPAVPTPLAASLAAAMPPAGAVDARAEHELGRRIYNFRCYFCHGYSGDGRTLASTYLQPAPRNFLATSPADLSPAQMREAVKAGRPGSAMQGFEGILTDTEIAAVVAFVRQEFMVERAANTRYHTPENGWPEHQQYAAAFPFADGSLLLDTPVATLTPEQRAGRRLFMSTCVSCHDRAHVGEPGLVWESHALSYPRNGFVPGDAQQVDTVSGASPYHLHDQAPKLAGLTAKELRGQALFQDNCAFCHGADGTGKNWIGSFLQPHPRDLTQPAFMQGMSAKRLASVIREGLPGTSMPAWKSVLKAPQIQALVAYIGRAFHPLAAAEPVAGQAKAARAQASP